MASTPDTILFDEEYTCANPRKSHSGPLDLDTIYPTLKVTDLPMLRPHSLLIVALIPTATLGQSCKQTVFRGTVRSGSEYSHSISSRLRFHLAPLKDDQGWVISVTPRGSVEDWTRPVTFPIRTGEQRQIGTGYGSTIMDKMTHPTIVHFVLTHADLVRYTRMANEEPAEAYVDEVSRLSKGQLTVTPLKYKLGNGTESVERMPFKAVAEVPKSFQGLRSPSRTAACPAQP